MPRTATPAPPATDTTVALLKSDRPTVGRGCCSFSTRVTTASAPGYDHHSKRGSPFGGAGSGHWHASVGGYLRQSQVWRACRIRSRKGRLARRLSRLSKPAILYSCRMNWIKAGTYQTAVKPPFKLNPPEVLARPRQASTADQAVTMCRRGTLWAIARDNAMGIAPLYVACLSAKPEFHPRIPI